MAFRITTMRLFKSRRKMAAKVFADGLGHSDHSTTLRQARPTYGLRVLKGCRGSRSCRCQTTFIFKPIVARGRYQPGADAVRMDQIRIQFNNLSPEVV